MNFSENNNISGAVYLWPHNSQPDASEDPFYADFVYNYDGDDYIEYNSTGSIPPGITDLHIASGQGFFVHLDHAEAASGEIVVFENSMRQLSAFYNNDTFFKNSQEVNQTLNQSVIEKHRIWLSLTGSNNLFDTALVGYVSYATNALDKAFDAPDFIESTLNIYSIQDNKTYSIQGRAVPFNQEDQVPLGINLPTNGNFTISIKHLDGLFEDENQNIYLEDVYNNFIHDLRESPYTFTSESGVINNRFILRYTNNLLSIEELTNSSSLIISAPNNEYIKVTSNGDIIKSVTVYDILGRILINKTDISDTEITLKEISKSNGTYIVKAELSNGKTKTQKVVLKN